MMSRAAIQQVSRDAAIRAVRENRIPFTVEEQDIPNWRARYKAGKLRFPFPFLGNYVPQGWRRTECNPLFVDSSGVGREDEPALTVNATIDALIPGKAYAIIDSGQFQLYLAEFERDDSAPGNEDEFIGLTSGEEKEFLEVVQQEEENFAGDIIEIVRRDFIRVDLDRRWKADVAIRFEGTICLFELKSGRARRWVRQHVADPRYFGDGIVVEHRFAKALVKALKKDRLRIG